MRAGQLTETLAAALASYDVHEPAVTAAQVRSLAPWTRQLRAVFEATSEAQRAERADALLVRVPGHLPHGCGGSAAALRQPVNVANHRFRHRRPPRPPSGADDAAVLAPALGHPA